MSSNTPLPSSLRSTADWFRNWLLEVAAPLWASHRQPGTALFPERITLAGVPDPNYYRTFVQARHVFSFVTIGQAGWDGPWRDLVTETMEFLIGRAKRSDGFYVNRIDAAGEIADGRIDLYDQAFVLLSLGSAGSALQRQDWFDEAEMLLDRIESEWEHPSGGFREGEIADPRLRRQNPHMHLLEAFIALDQGSGRKRFRAAACEIANLAKAKFIDEATGALLEYLDDDLGPIAGEDGRIAEPGHCFEWAWLFERLAANDWPDGVRLSNQLTAFARQWGVEAKRNVAINEVLTNGKTRNAAARLWPQTERLKAAAARYRRTCSAVEARDAIAAANSLKKYFDVPISGLWRDKLRADGTWVEEPSPGSSLYHISCAISELLAASGEDVLKSAESSNNYAAIISP